MRLVCPSCHAVYDVPQSRLGTGPRRVRCNRCAHEWTMPAPPPEPPPLPSPPLPPPRAVPPPLVMAARRPAPASFPDYEEEAPAWDRRAILGWVLSLALLAGLAAGAVRFRTEIMWAWPPSERVYTVMGLAAR